MKTITARISIDSRWSRAPGVEVKNDTVTIDVDKYFFRFEDPAWRIVDWEKVISNWETLNETPTKTLEQNCLDFITANSRQTTDAAEVLENAEKAYAVLFKENRPDVEPLPYVTPKHLQVLRESSTLMALNKVDRDGVARNVGPAWFFADCAQKVFDLTDEEKAEVDELYHGSFFTETRRVDSVKAHVAMGGRLVHGCSGKPNMSGGCVLEYGSSTEGFYRHLQHFRTGWIESIQAW